MLNIIRADANLHRFNKRIEAKELTGLPCIVAYLEWKEGCLKGHNLLSRVKFPEITCGKGLHT